MSNKSTQHETASVAPEATQETAHETRIKGLQGSLEMHADLVAVAREIANDSKCDLVYSERRIRLYAALEKLSAL